MNSQASSNTDQADQIQADQTDSPAPNKVSGASGFAAALARIQKEEAGDEPADSSADGQSIEEEESGKPRKSVKAAPADLGALAESLGVKVEDLYKVKVPASGGREAMTIGQIKDKFTEWESLETDRIAFDESKVKQEADFELAKQEIRELIAVIPKEHLNKEALGRVAAKLVERNKAQVGQVAAAFPEWKDEAVRTAQVADIENTLAAYGFSKQQAQTIRDPRLLKLIRDAARRERQVTKALEAIKRAPANKQTQQPGSRQAPRQTTQSQRPSSKPTTERERFTQALNRS